MEKVSVKVFLLFIIILALLSCIAINVSAIERAEEHCVLNPLSFCDCDRDCSDGKICLTHDTAEDVRLFCKSKGIASFINMARDNGSLGICSDVFSRTEIPSGGVIDKYVKEGTVFCPIKNTSVEVVTLSVKEEEVSPNVTEPFVSPSNNQVISKSVLLGILLFLFLVLFMLREFYFRKRLNKLLGVNKHLRNIVYRRRD